LSELRSLVEIFRLPRLVDVAGAVRMAETGSQNETVSVL